MNRTPRATAVVRLRAFIEAARAHGLFDLPDGDPHILAMMRDGVDPNLPGQSQGGDQSGKGDS